MGEVEVRLQPLRNFEVVREPAKTEEQKLYRTENGVINDIETQVYESKFINIKLILAYKPFSGEFHDAKT